MGLSLDDVKELIIFGQERGLRFLKAEGVEVVYGDQTPAFAMPTIPGDDERKQPADQVVSGIPEELRHYSVKGRAAFGKAP